MNQGDQLGRPWANAITINQVDDITHKKKAPSAMKSKIKELHHTRNRTQWWMFLC